MIKGVRRQLPVKWEDRGLKYFERESEGGIMTGLEVQGLSV